MGIPPKQIGINATASDFRGGKLASHLVRCDNSGALALSRFRELQNRHKSIRRLVSSSHLASGLHLFFSCPFERGFPEPDARSAPVLVDELDAGVLKGAANRKIIGCG
jgi:hypothetical protein